MPGAAVGSVGLFLDEPAPGLGQHTGRGSTASIPDSPDPLLVDGHPP